MSPEQIGGSIALAVIGLIMCVVSAAARDTLSRELSHFADTISKVGIFLGVAFMLPLVIGLLIGIVVGFPVRP